VKKIIAIISITLSSLVHGANISVDTSDPRVNVVYINGEIVQGDYNRFIDAVKSINNTRPVGVALEGPGGLLTEALAIGLEINRRQMTTLAFRGPCVSACAYIWIAGNRVIIDSDNGARIGFHAPYIQDKFGNTRSTSQGSAILGGYLRDIGANYNLIAFATSVEGDGMRWLTESSAKDIGIRVGFLNDKTKARIAQAKAEITKVNGWNSVFYDRQRQLLLSGKTTNDPDYIRIQRAIEQNKAYISQQLNIVNQAQ